MYTLSNSTDDVGYAMAIDQMEGGRYGAQARCRSLSGTPCLAALPPLGHARYVTEEFIVEGTANAFRPTRPLTEDGLWSVEQGERASYATRLVVCRPAAIEKFEGTVVVEWLNVSGGTDAGPIFSQIRRYVLKHGWIWVGVSAQRAGLFGGAIIQTGATPVSQMDPQRYGFLDHPGDAYAFDIFAQAGAAIRGGNLGALSGFKPQRFIAAAASQSSYFLTTFINGIAPVRPIFDGFLLSGRYGGAATFSGERTPERGDAVLVREDLHVPVLIVQSETDVLGKLYSYPARQPDSPWYRLWEVAGSAHADTYM